MASSVPSEQGETAGLKLTETEIKFLANAMQCMKNTPELDTDKLASLLGLAKKTVTNRWWELKKKLGSAASASADGAEGAPGGATPRTPSKRKAKAAAPAQDGAGEDEGEPAPPTSAKKPRTRTPRGPSKKKAAAAAAAAAEAAAAAAADPDPVEKAADEDATMDEAEEGV